MLSCSFQLSNSQRNTLFHTFFHQRCRQHKGVFGVRNKEVSILNRCCKDFFTMLLLQNIKAIVEHRDNQIGEIVILIRLNGLSFCPRSDVSFHVKTKTWNGLFSVFSTKNNHLFVVTHRIIHSFFSIFRLRNGSKARLNLCFYLVNINISHHNNSLQVGAIPSFIIVFQLLIGEITHDIHRSNGQTIFVFSTLINDRS